MGLILSTFFTSFGIRYIPSHFSIIKHHSVHLVQMLVLLMVNSVSGVSVIPSDFGLFLGLGLDVCFLDLFTSLRDLFPLYTFYKSHEPFWGIFMSRGRSFFDLSLALGFR